MTSPTETTPQVDQQYIISTLVEENRALNENRMYLMALVKQLKAEFDEAKTTWELERDSLKTPKK